MAPLIRINTPNDTDVTRFWYGCQVDSTRRAAATQEGRTTPLTEDRAQQLAGAQDYIPLLKGLWAMTDRNARAALLKRHIDHGEHTILLFELALTCAGGAKDDEAVSVFTRFVVPYKVLGLSRLQQDIACFSDQSVSEALNLILLGFSTRLEAILRQKGFSDAPQLDSTRVQQKIARLAANILGPRQRPSSPAWLRTHALSVNPLFGGTMPDPLLPEVAWPAKRQEVYANVLRQLSVDAQGTRDVEEEAAATGEG